MLNFYITFDYSASAISFKLKHNGSVVFDDTEHCNTFSNRELDSIERSLLSKYISFLFSNRTAEWSDESKLLLFRVINDRDFPFILTDPKYSLGVSPSFISVHHICNGYNPLDYKSSRRFHSVCRKSRLSDKPTIFYLGD